MKQKTKNAIVALIMVLSGTLVFSQPVNDNPCGAIYLGVNQICIPTYINQFNLATNSSASIPGLLAPSCGSYSGKDIWFRCIIPPSGSLNIQMTPEDLTDAAMAIYTASSCNGPFTFIQCDDDSGTGNMPMINASGLPAGSDLYIRVWNKTGNLAGSFKICAATYSTCGTPNSHDYCATPLPIQPGGSLYISNYPLYGVGGTTATSASPDLPGNLSGIACGSIEKNLWFEFTATSSSETFSFSDFFGNPSIGIQVRVYQVAYTANGCCNSFTPKSSCATGAPLTVTATGLTPGMQYLLMIDSQNGYDNEFILNGWGSVGPLPVSLIELTGSNLEDGNLIHWKTESEYKNDYFILEHSRNGTDFNEIATITGNGTTTTPHQYEFLHQGVDLGTNYYKLSQVDFDGYKTEYQIFAVINETSKNGIYKIAPNPANESTTVFYQSKGKQELTISWCDSRGAIVSTSDHHVTDGMNLLFLPIDHFESGVYFLKIESPEGTKIERIIIE